jgi:hypothetical protein
MTRLQVCYDADLYFKSNLDSQIEKVVGKECSGSGMGLGERDIGFTFRSRKDAEEAEKKLKKFIKTKKLTKRISLTIY